MVRKLTLLFFVAAALGHDGHLHVAGVPDDPVNQIAAQESLPPRVLGAGHEDLRDAMEVGKVNQGIDDVRALQQSGLKMKVTREVEVPLDGFPFGRR